MDETKKTIHTGLSTTMGLIIGAAGGMAVGAYLSDEERREKLKTKVITLKTKAKKKWEEFNTVTSEKKETKGKKQVLQDVEKYPE